MDVHDIYRKHDSMNLVRVATLIAAVSVFVASPAAAKKSKKKTPRPLGRPSF